MIAFILFFILALIALCVPLFVKPLPAVTRVALFVLAPLLLTAGFLIGSSVVIPSTMTGVVIRHIGHAMPPGAILARDGEQGPEARILGPGWHFGIFPFLYEVELHPVMEVPHGKFGFISAADGKPLSQDETFAQEWDNTADLLNPETFLAGHGQRGPQTTVLTPGTYRYNPRLHKIELHDALNVAPGTVAVIKANTGSLAAGDATQTTVNGTPLVKKGFRGVWAQPLSPGAYYLNTEAFQPTIVRTTQRVYTYQQATTSKTTKGHGSDDWSVSVRSKDGFTFPVDVRLSVAVEAKDAPYLVALLGDPDRRIHDDQEDEDLEVLEAKVVLPTVRAIFRNVTEDMNALEFVNARSTIERTAGTRMKAELAKYHLTCDGVYVGNIHLDATEAGRQLISTQTDREVAVNQQILYAEQKKAQESRSAFVKAQEEAEQQRNLAKATYEVLVKEQQAKARAAEAKGEADYQKITGEGRAQAYRAMVEALGRDSVAQLELLKLVADGKIQITPQVMVNGGGASGGMDALMGTILKQATEDASKKGQK